MLNTHIRTQNKESTTHLISVHWLHYSLAWWDLYRPWTFELCFCSPYEAVYPLSVPSPHWSPECYAQRQWFYQYMDRVNSLTQR